MDDVLCIYQSLFPFGFTGVYDPIFGCTVVDPISLSLSQKYDTIICILVCTLLTDYGTHRCSLSRLRLSGNSLAYLCFNSVVIICRTCFITADMLLIYITWSTISRKGIFDSVARRDTLTLAGVLLNNGARTHNFLWTVQLGNQLTMSYSGTLYFAYAPIFSLSIASLSSADIIFILRSSVLLALHCLHLILSLCSVGPLRAETVKLLTTNTSSQIHVALQSFSYGYVTVFTEA